MKTLRNLVFFFGLTVFPFISSSQTQSPVTYAQILIHTADGATYLVTGDALSFVYKTAPDGVDFVVCVEVGGAIGLPPATNDIIFRNGFETPSLCWPSTTGGN